MKKAWELCKDVERPHAQPLPMLAPRLQPVILGPPAHRLDLSPLGPFQIQGQQAAQEGLPGLGAAKRQAEGIPLGVGGPEGILGGEEGLCQVRPAIGRQHGPIQIPVEVVEPGGPTRLALVVKGREGALLQGGRQPPRGSANDHGPRAASWRPRSQHRVVSH